MLQTWQELEGKVINDQFLLVRCLEGLPASGVFLADEIGQGGPSAIKLVPLGSADEQAAEAQLLRLRAAETLSHPNLIGILGAGRWESAEGAFLYVRMEYAEENLAQLLPQRRLTNDEASLLLEAMVAALGYLHSQGFVHGHITPSNVMAIADQVKLSTDRLHRVGERIQVEQGSIYAAPEAVEQGAVAASDSWSLGVTLVEALTGQPPVWDKHKEPLLPASVPPQFREVVRHCLRRDPEQRWSIAEIAAALHPEASRKPATVAATAAAGSSVSAPIPARSSAKRSYAGVAVAAAVGVVALIGFTTGDPSGSGKPSPPQQQSAEVIENDSSATATKEGSGSAPQASQRAVQKQPETTPGRTTVPLGLKERAPSSPAVPDAVLHREMPEVSQGALNTITGTVRVGVRVRVNSSGAVESASFASRGPSSYFAERSLRAARLWKFAPQGERQQNAAGEWLLRFRYRKSGTEVIAEQAGS